MILVPMEDAGKGSLVQLADAYSSAGGLEA